MKSNYLTTMTVQIPREGTVIRNEKTVEYQMDRTYAPEDKSTRVKRKVIGKVDPLQPGRMFPNEMYFEMFPDNEVPEDVRDEFLRDCAIKRDMGVIRQNPEEIVERVVEGLDMLSQGGWAGEDGANRPIRIGPASSVPTGPSVPAGPGQYLRLIEEGLTYSDVLLMLKWYKVLPR